MPNIKNLQGCERMAEEKKVTTEKTKSKQKSKSDASVSKFLKETIIELKKVVWPTKKQLAVYTAVVIIASILLSLLIWGFDTLFISAFDKLFLNK